MQLTDDLADLIAALDRIDDLRRWERSLVEVLDRLSEPAPQPTTPSPRLGIDLAEKHGDIRKLLATFGLRAVRTNGWVFEELLSDVYTKIAQANLGLHPYDPSKSSLGTYVVMTIRSVITNRWRKETQRGRLARTVAIDDPGVHLQLGRSMDVDGMIDATAAFEEFRARQPEIVDGFLAGHTPIGLERAGVAPRRAAYAARMGLRRALAG